MNTPYATSNQAAMVGGTTPEQIGVPATNYVRKIDLVNSGKFDVSKLTGYTDSSFVLVTDIAKGSIRVSIAMASDILTRGTVQINSGTPGQSVSLEVNIGDSVTVKCLLTKVGDVFAGWYENGVTLKSTEKDYTFTVSDAVHLVARGWFIDAYPASLSFTNEGGTKTFKVTTNAPTVTIS